MSELAPGFYVDDWVPPGRIYRMQIGMFYGHAGPATAIHPSDWERIPGADRERLLDELTRADARRGQALLEAALVESSEDGTEP